MIQMMKKMKMTPTIIYRTYRRTSFFRRRRFLRFWTIKLTLVTFSCKINILSLIDRTGSSQVKRSIDLRPIRELPFFFFFRLSEFFFYPLLGRARFRGMCWAAIRLSHRPEPSGRAVRGEVDGLDIAGRPGRRFVYLRHTHRPQRRPYPFVQAGAETSDTGAEAVKPDPDSFWEGHSGWVWTGIWNWNAESCGVVRPLRVPLMFRPLRRTYVVAVREAKFARFRWWWGQWGGYEHCGHQRGAQYSAVEWTRAKVAVRNVVDPAPQPETANRLRSATRDVSFLRSDSRCRRYVSDLSNVTPTYLGWEQKGRVSLLKLTFSSRLASLLLRRKIANTVFVVLSFSFQVWRHTPSVAMFLLSAPSTACQSPSACMIARSSANAYFLEMVVGRSKV